MTVSTCPACLLARQVALNFLLLADYALNTLLGGHPAETVSARAARAEAAGNHWAARFCRLADRLHAGHCAYALTPGNMGREVWNWTPKRQRILTKETIHG